MKKIITALVAVLALGACGGHEIDREEWKADLSEAGLTVVDWPQYEDAAKNICDFDEETFSYTVALAMDDGMTEHLRIDVEHVCPDREDELNETIGSLS